MKTVCPYLLLSKMKEVVRYVLKYGITLPQGWTTDLIEITDPVQAYETMTHMAQTAEECGYESVWLIDHFHQLSQPLC